MVRKQDAGTRITVESILERLAAGEGEDEILAAQPRLIVFPTASAMFIGTDIAARRH